MISISQPIEPTYRVAVSRYALTQKIPAGDPFWPTFNGSFSNQNVTPTELISRIWDGHPFTTWHANQWRTSTNYISGQHLGLDMDTEDARSTLAALGQDPFIRRYASFAYTTPSHRPEAPRARVVFLLDTPIMQAKNYTLAAAALLWLYSTADRQCKDAVRFFYGAQKCDVEIWDNVLPLSVIKGVIASYQDTGLRARKRQKWDGAPAEMRDVEAALDYIDPWQIDYGEWVNVLMALHAEYDDAGLPLAEHWGCGDGDEIARRWKGFKSNGNGSGAVTIATVFGLAKRFGWKKVA